MYVLGLCDNRKSIIMMQLIITIITIVQCMHEIHQNTTLRSCKSLHIILLHQVYLVRKCVSIYVRIQCML